MYSTKIPLTKAMFLTTALLSLGANAVDFNKGATVSMCDGFGKTWSVQVAGCNPNAPLSVCLTGQRDTLNLNGCGGGAQTMFGVSVGVRHLFNAYTVESEGCSSTFWEGVGQNKKNGNISGNVFNSFGTFGAFTLTQGVCGASAGSGSDPAK